MSSADRVQDLGEQGLLGLLQSFCPADVVGDDAALLAVTAGQSLVVTSDLLVDQIHFSDRTTSAADVGWRAAAANLSDLAAMGATPLGITVALGLPGTLTIDWVQHLYQGISECLQPFGTPIVGGDVCRSSLTTVAITAFGEVSPTRAIRRSAARPGDAILVTGFHGASRAGLELLLHPERGARLAAPDRVDLIRAHQRPRPRLDILPLLEDVWRSTALLAGMDSSDGLADAVLQICRASHVGAQLERSHIPLPPALMMFAPDQALEWALYGGEDFELVLCLPPQAAATLLPHLGAGAAIVGTITAEQTVILRDSIDRHPDEVLTLEKGFQHF